MTRHSDITTIAGMTQHTAGSGNVVVVGAGMVGLATAWFLQERGMFVTVLDRGLVGAGSSFGNAGWLTPGISTPLPEPAVLRQGIRALLSPNSPVYVPPAASIHLLPFLLRFARNSTTKRWEKAMAALVPINRLALAAYDTLTSGGVAAPVHEPESLLAAYRSEPERRTLLDEIEHIRSAGQSVEFDVLSGNEAREYEPSLSDEIGAGIRIYGQRFVDPGAFVAALAESVRSRGGNIRTGITVTALRHASDSVSIVANGEVLDPCGAIVLATGASLSDLARQVGVRTSVRAGRGYSFSSTIDHLPSGPIYFPSQRIACTPLSGRLRIAGMMEFRAPDAPLDARRIQAIVGATRPLLRGVDLDIRSNEWVGSRPVTPNGLPLIGATRSSRVFVAGGHGMWGITLGPVTGQLLAELIATGTPPNGLTALNPLR